MAAQRCPRADVSCEACIADFAGEHPDAEVWRHTAYHHCGCAVLATYPDGAEVCVGCGERRDLFAEFRAFREGSRT